MTTPKTLSDLSIAQLQEAISIREQINKLEDRLNSLFGESSAKMPAASRPTTPARRGGKRIMSPEARERIAAAQRARWAKQRGEAGPAAGKPVAASKKAARGGRLNASARAKIAAAMRARWAERKAAAGAPGPKAAPAKKGKMSAAARARLSAMMKERWAKRKAGKR